MTIFIVIITCLCCSGAGFVIGYIVASYKNDKNSKQEKHNPWIYADAYQHFQNELLRKQWRSIEIMLEEQEKALANALLDGKC